MKKLQLEVDGDINFLLIGIVTSQNISRLGFLLNRHSDLNLSREEDLNLSDFNPDHQSSFSKLDYWDEENHLDFSLIANRDSGEYLHPGIKQFDYLLVIRGGLEFFNRSAFLDSMRQLQEIRLISEIEDYKLKNKLSWIV
ncbi:hypothetical protein MASR2M44_22460 [Bacteroidota bacterium]